MRECIPLRDLTDCLLQAYDRVARRAYQRFLNRGGVPGGELEDWLSAEHELLGNLPVDLEDAGNSLSALASVPGLTGGELEIGIDSRWLVILGRNPQGEAVSELEDLDVDPNRVAAWASSVHADARTLRVCSQQGKEQQMAASQDGTRGLPPAVRADAGISVTVAEGVSNYQRSLQKADILKANESNGFSSWPSEGNGLDPVQTGAPSQLFCVMELPAEVDPARSVAVLANGLLGIRMPKRPPVQR